MPIFNLVVSDERRKKNISKYKDSALDKLDSLLVVQYHYNNQSDKDSLHLGVIAQNLKEIYPEFVKTDDTVPEKYLSVDYSLLVVPLIKAIQELKQINDVLDRRIFKLDRELEAMKKRKDLL